MSQATRFVPSSLRSQPDGGATAAETEPPRVLIFGGSQGAHAINVAMVEAAPRLAADGGVDITHQTGERDVELVRTAYRDAGLAARVEPFLFAMDREMKQADVIVCRAGATTIAELTAAGRAAILIPLPTAADDHQTQERRGAGARRRGGIDRAEGPDRRGARGSAAGAGPRSGAARRRSRRRRARLAQPDAAKVIVDRALELAGRWAMARTRC